MADEVNLRNLALDVIVSVMDKGAYSDKAIHAALEKHPGLEKRDRAFFTRLCQGTIEYAVSSDYIINLFSKTKVKKNETCYQRNTKNGSLPDNAYG